MSTPCPERAATPIGEYRRLTTSEGALSHQFLPAMGTRVATHQALASFRRHPKAREGERGTRQRAAKTLPPQPVLLALTCHTSGSLRLRLKAAIGHRTATIDAKPVAALIQPAKRLKYEHSPGFGRGEYRLGAIRLRQVRSGVGRILRIVGDERMLMVSSVQHGN